MLTNSIIIPTYNRPDDLRNCLQTLLSQTRAPTELIVVDDGNLENVPLADEFAGAGISLIYIKKNHPGLTESRNEGIRIASGDIIFFLDDDVLLFPDYLEQIMVVYEEQEGFIGGVGGLEDNKPAMRHRDYIKRIFELPFLTWGLREGRVLRSGFCTQFGESPIPIKNITRVDFLSGGVSSFDRRIFSEFAFTPRFREHGLGEDKDFTIMVSRHHSLYVNPKARLIHLEAQVMRPQDRRFSRMFLIGTFLLFSRHMKRGWYDWPIFWYSVFGYTLVRSLAFLVFPNRGKLEKLKGIADAVKTILTGQVIDLKADTDQSS